MVIAIIGAMLAFRRQREEMVNQAALLARGAAASPAPPTVAPSTSPAGTPTQTAPAVGTVKIVTTPSGAQVELDGTQVGTTATALMLSDVKPGKHTLKIAKTGFQTVSREVQIVAGESVHLELTLTASRAPSGPRRRPAAAPPLPPPP